MYKRILVPLDGSVTSERGLREAIGLAGGIGAAIHLLHVVAEFPVLAQMSTAAHYQDTLEGFRKYGAGLLSRALQATATAGLQADSALRELSHGRISEAIVEEAARAQCDLIVMGTHGRRGFNLLTMGSEADLVVRTSRVPVLLLRQDEPALLSKA